MVQVIGVSFKEKGQIYYFFPNDFQLKRNVTVIVETERGLQFGKIETAVLEIDEKRFSSDIKKVVRIATKEDYYNHKKNLKEAEEALKICREIADKNNMKMQITEASYTFDREQLMFKFLSDNRVDFRELVKSLASIFHTRIELRQIGARDKAREIGGCGLCGRDLCCGSFLKDLDSVTIGMAKNQNLSLNPSKINGVCGRLLCCLKYEDNCYKENRFGMPIIGKKVSTKDGSGEVISIDILKRTYRVYVPDIGVLELKAEENGNN